MQSLRPARGRAAVPPILYALLLALGLAALPLVLRAQGSSITVNSLADPGDGRYVVFESLGTNLGSNTRLFVRDRGATVLHVRLYLPHVQGD